MFYYRRQLKRHFLFELPQADVMQTTSERHLVFFNVKVERFYLKIDTIGINQSLRLLLWWGT